MSSENVEIFWASRPEKEIVPDKTFARRVIPTPSSSDLQDGQLLVETLYVSLDPVMRRWLSEPSPPLDLHIGGRMLSPTLSRVIASRSPDYQAGDLVTSWVGWVNYAIVDADKVDKAPVPEGAKVSDALGQLGLTGLSAYFGMLRIGRPKKGETVLVSTAAGAVGNVAAQIAKIYGAKVVGIAGGKDKCRFLLEDLGLDAALDYKAPDFEARFAEAVDTGIDVYFDNVGGKILQMAIDKANRFSRIVICGAVSTYNQADSNGSIDDTLKLALKSITMQGFSVLDYISEADIARADLIKWAQEGRLRRVETVVRGGLELAPTALADMVAGKNMGKMLLEVKAA
ncbi:hypothetical protein A1O3_03982 [Capronia epimyces CBS 606.96]|uniref:Enoyl reductase (ER) domain-containing protein n=1 Tax=Capronia epimyces CBS 606.96 TaxID=1182542 RepID=W9YBJ2_9EURO|nr:uncharacterized protein A1O3_03982 [Capronia epimyces CBS 606.96]EXJ87025.1 hypothetical protein A1O3_03982 [Capronia epimyces CBS 606.96]